MRKQIGLASRRAGSLLLAGSLALGVTAPAYAEEIGDGVYATYDEAYYVNLDYYGNLKDASMVKSYILNGVDTVKDYGVYESINNLTDGTPPAEEDGAHVFRFEGNVPTHFYFEGKTEQPFAEMPWTIAVSYKLNGVPTKAEDLAGKTGMIEIDVDAVPRENASEYAKNNYTLEVMGLFNQDNILSLEAPGAQVQLIGNLRAVLFLGLPGSEEHFEIRVGAEDFAFSGLTLLMVPANLGALDQLSDLSDKKEELEDNYHKLDSSIDTLLNSFSGMSASLRETASGLDELNEARGILSDEKGGLYEQADAALADADVLREDLTTASENLEELKEKADRAAEDLGALDTVLGETGESLQRLENALETLDKDLSLLRSYARGSGNELKSALRAVASDAAALQDAMGDFTQTLALLDVQIGGKDITVQGIATQDLAAKQEQAQAVLDLYDETSAIAPIASADMFMAAANAMSQGISSAESMAQLQAQKEQLTQAILAVIEGSQGAIPDEATAIAYIEANAAADPTFAAIAAALQQKELMTTLYAQTATGKNGLMTEEDFMTALLMAQDIQAGKSASAVIANKGTYRSSVAKSFALMETLETGVLANLSSLCGSLSKGSKAAADLIGGSNSSLSKRADMVADDLDTLAARTEKLLTQTAALLTQLQDMGEDALEDIPDLQQDLTDIQMLLQHLDQTAEDTSGLLRSFEVVMQAVGDKLDDGTKKTLAGLASTLRKLADSTDTTGSVRAAKNGMTDIVEDVWDDYTGKLNNLLLMDPSAPPQSLTDNRNEAPTSIQILLRTQEIKVSDADAGTDSSDAERSQQTAEGTFWTRLADLFRGIAGDLAKLLHRGKEAADL